MSVCKDLKEKQDFKKEKKNMASETGKHTPYSDSNLHFSRTRCDLYIHDKQFAYQGKKRKGLLIVGNRGM